MASRSSNLIIKSLGLLVVVGAISGGDCRQEITDYGAESNAAMSPLGGGDGYNDYPHLNPARSKIIEVRTLAQLMLALDSAVPGSIIYIDSGASLDLTGLEQIIIPEQVTLAGNRGLKGSLGPLLFTNTKIRNYVLRLESGSRVTGLRIRGPDVNFSEIEYPVSPFVKGKDEQSNAKCLGIFGRNVEVDNCEISNFHRVGIDAQKGTSDLVVHHNYLHDIHAYPILVVDRSSMPIIIEANVIEWIWHAIAGTGAPGTGYEARYNRLISKPIPNSWISQGSHAIDMHPDADIKDNRGDLVAGDIVLVHHNTFINQSGFHRSIKKLEDAKIRGVPRILARFHHNIFQNSNPEDAIAYDGEPGNIWVDNNLYGNHLDPVEIGPQSTPQILFNMPPPPEINVPVLSSGTIDIDVVIHTLPGININNVRYYLDDSIIYDGHDIPQAGQLKIAVTSKNKMASELKVIATDHLGHTGSHKTIFKISN